jgi:hypothetical protein
MPWQDTGNSQSGKLPITVKYAKKLVSGSDKLLKTDYLQGIDWFNDNEFSLFVEKKELWQNAGEIVAIRKTSPRLKFDLAHSEHKTKEVLNFDFNGKLTTDRTQKVDISQDGWTLKRDTVKAKISFTNNSEFFEDVFSYPFFEASYTLEGKKFDFDLSVEFKENHQITKFSDSKAQNVTTAVATFDNKRFEKEVMTSLIKKYFRMLILFPTTSMRLPASSRKKYTPIKKRAKRNITTRSVFDFIPLTAISIRS